jgi:hypothetical protein
MKNNLLKVILGITVASAALLISGCEVSCSQRIYQHTNPYDSIYTQMSSRHYDPQLSYSRAR